MNKSVFIGAAAACTILGGVTVYSIWQDLIPGLEPVAHRNAGSLSRSAAAAISMAAPPGAPPVAAVTYQPIAAQTAQEINAAVPLASVGPAARPFDIPSGTPTWNRASHCLAQAVYYEAGSESAAGQQAVAQVVLNRVRSPAFPNSICGVVYQGSEGSTGCQFTFTCDGSLRREPSGAGWHRAMDVAASALKGRVYVPVGSATHYHANYVVPYWAASMAKIRTIGAHDFYRWPGSWRAGTYFSQQYANAEPDEGLIHATLPVIGETIATAPAPPADPRRLAADFGAPAHSRTELPLAIDQKPHTLVAGEHASALDPRLNRIVVLSADLQAGRLEPTPLPRGKDH